MPNKSAHKQRPLRSDGENHNEQIFRGKDCPRSLNPCTPLSDLFSLPLGQEQSTQARTFYSLCGRLCWTRIVYFFLDYKDSYIHDLYRHTSYLSKKVLSGFYMCLPVDIARKPTGNV